MHLLLLEASETHTRIVRRSDLQLQPFLKDFEWQFK